MKYLLVLPLMAALSLSARTLTPTEALLRAQPSVPHAIAATATVSHTLLVHTFADSLTATPYIYAYDMQSGQHDAGWLLVSADDVASPLLGYSLHGNFDADQMPPNMRQWLEMYAHQIASVPDLLRNAPEGTDSKWQRPHREDVAPLMVTEWNQGDPYNKLCPTLSYQRCYTGCAATAMAQVMKYHNWPAKGTGSISYQWEEGNKSLSMDFAKTTFDWKNMLANYEEESYTSTEATAVATLMKACGYSSQMNYSPQGSGTSLQDCGVALMKYFDYAPTVQYVVRNNYTLMQWEQLLYDEIAAHRPVQMEGYNDIPAGHSFVTDGYEGEGYYHFNWGWGGQSDGYFRLTALEPDSQGAGGSAAGYTLAQGALIGVQPSADGLTAALPMVGCYNSYYDARADNGNLALEGYLINQGLNDFTGRIAFVAENVATGDVTELDGVDIDANDPLEPMHGWSSLTLDDFTALDKGDYRLRITYKCTGQTTCSPTLWCAEQAPYILFTLDAKHKVTAASVPLRNDVSITRLVQASPLYKGTYFSMRPETSSNATEAVWGAIQPTLYTSKTAKSAAATLPSFTMPILPGTDTLTLSAETPSSLSTGRYYLRFEQIIGQLINGTYTTVPMSDFFEVTVASNPGSPVLGDCTFSIANADAVEPSAIRISYEVKLTSGYMSEPLYVAFFNRDGGTSLAVYPMPMVTASPEAPAVGSWSVAWPAAQPETEYLCGIYRLVDNGYSSSYERISDRLYFTTAPVSGLNDLTQATSVILTPNPVGHQACLQAGQDITTVQLTGINGAFTDLPAEISGSVATLDTSALAPGWYMLIVTHTDGSRHVLRMIKR